MEGAAPEPQRLAGEVGCPDPRGVLPAPIDQQPGPQHPPDGIRAVAAPECCLGQVEKFCPFVPVDRLDVGQQFVHNGTNRRAEASPGPFVPEGFPLGLEFLAVHGMASDFQFQQVDEAWSLVFRTLPWRTPRFAIRSANSYIQFFRGPVPPEVVTEQRADVVPQEFSL
jgi:hypothetical protein